MLLAKNLPRITAGGRLADAAVGLGGGLIGGLGGFTGVLPTLWCTLRRYERDVQRSVIQNFNLAMLGVTMATYLASGLVTRATLPMLAVVLPAMLIPIAAGHADLSRHQRGGVPPPGARPPDRLGPRR